MCTRVVSTGPLQPLMPTKKCQILYTRPQGSTRWQKFLSAYVDGLVQRPGANFSNEKKISNSLSHFAHTWGLWMQNLPLQCRTDFQCLRTFFQDKKVAESEEPAERKHPRVQQPAESWKKETLYKLTVYYNLIFGILHVLVQAFPAWFCPFGSKFLASVVHIFWGSKHVCYLTSLR